MTDFEAPKLGKALKVFQQGLIDLRKYSFSAKKGLLLHVIGSGYALAYFEVEVEEQLGTRLDS